MSRVPREIPDALALAFSYDPTTGLISRVSTGHVQQNGRGGYVSVWFDGKVYRGHRVAWFLHHGEQPAGEVDHINGDCGDNRICNLRLAARHQNAWNTRGRGPNGKGVSFSKRDGKFEAAIRIGKGRRVRLGRYATAEEARAAYIAGAIKFHGEFARTE